MALKFSEMVARLSADERKLLDNTFAKYPELKEDWKSVEEDGLRQADYSRKMNELKSKETEFTELQAYKEKQEPWAETAYQRIHSMEEAGVIDGDGNVLWMAQKAELERQLDEAKKQSVGGEMDAAELDKRVRAIVKENGGVSPEELKALIASESKKLAEETFNEQWKTKETDFNSKTIPFVAGFSAATAVAAQKYEKETGKQWTADTAKQFFELMSKENNFDPYAVIEKFVEPDKRAKDMEIEIERRAVEKAKTMRSMPGGGGEDFIPQPEAKGAVQKMLEASMDSTDFEARVKAGAVKAAMELQAEGKA